MMTVTWFWFQHQVSGERIRVSVASDGVSNVSVESVSAAMQIPWVRIREPDFVEEELKNDKLIYGNCFWRVVNGRKVRVSPLDVQCSPTKHGRGEQQYKFFVAGEMWEVFGESR